MMGGLLAVVLHYGDPALTRAVEKALRQEAPEDAVLVLDNAAPQPYPGALRLPANVFWGGALEMALELARRRGATYLWFCNNDIRFVSPPPYLLRAAGRLARLEQVLGQPVGVWAPAVTGNPYHPQMVQARGLQYRSVTYVDGIAPVLRLECVDAVGGLDIDANPQGYGLDVWLSLRAYQAGWPVIVDQQVIVRHRYHTTARAVDGFLERAAVAENAYMSARLGPDWRIHLQQLQTCRIDAAEL